jgi:NAD(P)-dependent dehydrogenase (short-subunit alcohol dehydrogenase family)
MTVSTPALPLAPERGVLRGRLAFVAGAGPAGIAAARALAREGAAVALAGGDDLALLRTSRAIELSGGRAIPLPGDARDPEAIRRAVDSARQSFGGLHLAVNTIGAIDGPRSGSDAACRAVYVAMHCELPAILAAGGGAIVNAAPTPLGRHTEEAHCIIGLSKAAAIDHRDRGVRVNAIVTGDGSPAEFAAVAVWLCSDEAAHVTGATIPARLRPMSAAAQPTQPGRTRPYS